MDSGVIKSVWFQNYFPQWKLFWAGYERGRTSTHEIGHYLVYAILEAMEIIMVNGDCSATDYCDETPHN